MDLDMIGYPVSNLLIRAEAADGILCCGDQAEKLDKLDPPRFIGLLLGWPPSPGVRFCVTVACEQRGFGA
jgi:hypothetical protein